MHHRRPSNYYYCNHHTNNLSVVIGREIYQEFIYSLPNDADPNGENNEYHTFRYDDPIFKYLILLWTGFQSYNICLNDAYTYRFANLKGY